MAQAVAMHGTDDAEPVETGHLVIDQRDVGPLPTDQLERFDPVVGFAHDDEAAVLGQPSANTIAEERVVVGDDDAHPSRRFCHGVQ